MAEFAAAAAAAGSEVQVQRYSDPAFDPDEVIRRAVSRLGEKGYNPATNNCEHFARWCATPAHVAATCACGSHLQ